MGFCEVWNLSKTIKIGKLTIHPRFTVALLIFIGVIILVTAVFSGRGNYIPVSEGSVIINRTADIMILRNETVYFIPDAMEVTPRIGEGSMVVVGETVAAWIKSDDLLEVQGEKIWLDREIIESLILNISDELTEGFEVVNSDIKSAAIGYQDALLRGETKKADAYDDILRNNLLHRRQWLDENSTADKWTTSLYEKEIENSRKIENMLMDIKSPDDGVLSFSVDGLENKWSIEKALDYRTKDIVDAAVNGEIKSDLSDYEDGFVYKIAAEGRWLIAAVIKTPCPYEKGDRIRIDIEGHTRAHWATVWEVDLKVSGKAVVWMESYGNQDRFIDFRFSKAVIGRETEGMKVRVSSLKKRKGQLGVIIKGGGGVFHSTKFIEVEVLASDGIEAVIMPLKQNTGFSADDHVKR